jgi:hypothetical protein
MHFEIIGDIGSIEVIAVSSSIREINQLQKEFGKGRWRKLKGVARVRLANEGVRLAEVHWYEAHGIGKKNSKSKGFWTRAYEKGNASQAIRNLCHEYGAGLGIQKSIPGVAGQIGGPK